VDDNEFKRLVLERLDEIDRRVESDRLHVDRRLDAVVARLDERDLFIERLIEKVNRLGTQVGLVAQASEQALDAITRLLKRVTRLEHPDGDFPSGQA
jgi:tetrahydromethanopterin S-methyltransferase subunit G